MEENSNETLIIKEIHILKLKREYIMKLLTLNIKATLHICHLVFIHSHNNYEASTICQILAGHMEVKDIAPVL